jgi:hypothetical protein
MCLLLNVHRIRFQIKDVYYYQSIFNAVNKNIVRLTAFNETH